jgi:hypothetical protein
VALTSGLNASRRVLILAGITTFGTQAAVEFVCRAQRLDELMAAKLESGPLGAPRRFRRLKPYFGCR